MDKILYIVGLILVVALMIKLKEIVRDTSKSALLRAVIVVGGIFLFIALIIAMLTGSLMFIK